ncbi:MAG: sugar phosphate isomerase/epimerase, partial [Chloroflexi bacterium]|nr:sugar phosphate isomerase/epimerase [Chloroflexota bacterium]
MIKLGVNSVLFGGFDFATAARYIKMAGYDGVEISAIKGMCEHLTLDRWREQAAELKQIVADNSLEFLS